MSYLLHTLRTQHAVLERMAGTIEAALEGESYREVSELLPRFKDALLTHLELEEQVYPALISAAEQFRAGRVMESTRMFQSNMVFIQRSLKEFLSRWSVDLIATPSFRKEWSELTDLLETRIHAEEATLYRAYESLVERARAAPRGA